MTESKRPFYNSIMYPEDRVLITALPRPADFARLQREGWYRIPQRHAPKGLYAEYYAFYFGSRFGRQKWAIHYYAPRLGHELTTRRTLLPDEPDHPRADELYYKVQLGELRPLAQPIVSLQWRRITFLHTTWDRFQDATEINDLTIAGGYYVNREFSALQETPLPVQQYRTKGNHRGGLATIPTTYFPLQQISCYAVQYAR